MSKNLTLDDSRIDTIDYEEIEVCLDGGGTVTVKNLAGGRDCSMQNRRRAYAQGLRKRYIEYLKKNEVVRTRLDPDTAVMTIAIETSKGEASRRKSIKKSWAE